MHRVLGVVVLSIATVTWRWTTDIPETRPVIYRLTKKGIKGMLFEKKVIFSVEEQRNCLVEAMYS